MARIKISENTMGPMMVDRRTCARHKSCILIFMLGEVKFTEVGKMDGVVSHQALRRAVGVL